MTQLSGWQYKGHDFVGYTGMGNSCLVGVNELAEIYTIRIGEVTDLQPAKVVPMDSAVIDKAQLNIIRLAVKEGIEGIDSWRTKTYLQPDESVKARGALAAISQIVNGFPVTLTPPVTEPKRFGAIVEAKLDGRHGISSFPVAERKHLWKLEGSEWKLINGVGLGAVWCWFIDPVVISEGQK